LTEIPEHLLQRSRERRAALGLGGDAPASGSGGEAASTPAPAESAATPVPAGEGGGRPPSTPAVPAEPKPEPPKPVPAYVQAAQRRRRIPLWAMPVLAALPIWSYVYVRTLEPAPVENDPIELGAALFAPCGACHGGSGQGAGAPQLSDGHVEATWPDFRDQLMWVKLGAEGWPGDTYGAEHISKDANSGVMPGYAGSLSEQEIAQVVLYERRELSDDVPPEGEEDVLLAIANGEMTFAEAGLGPLSEEAGLTDADLEG